MSAPILSINGQRVDAATATVSALDRGFLYGDGVFEVLRAYGGIPHALEEHLGRLRASAAQVGLSLPVPLAQLRVEVCELLADLGAVDAHVRLVVTRGRGDLGVAPHNAHAPTRMIVATPLIAVTRSRYTDGVRAATVRLPQLAARGALSGAKTLNYLANVVWMQQARAQGFDEALLVAHGDVVVEAATANVFVVSGHDVMTPATEVGALPGVTRAAVLACASSAGVRAREGRVTLADLWTADEVFLTSSVRELVPVVRVDDHEVGEGRPGEVTRALHRAYRATTPAVGVAMPWV